MTETGHELILNYIDGEWVDSESKGRVDNVNPADTREVLGQCVESGKSDTLRAIDSAKRAFPRWKKVPAPKRAAILFEVLRLMNERKEALARALCLEEGKTYTESLGEVNKTIQIMEFMTGEGFRMSGKTVPSVMPNNFAYTVRAPLGVVGLITPWNFPVCIPAWKIAPAMLTGNTMVFKPSPLTPWTAKMVVEIFEEAGVPKGVINMVHGGIEVGETITTHPDVAALSFTGSNAVGSKVYEAGAKSLKKVQCEMGGKNPVIVLEDADLQLAAVATAQGAFASTGQRCTATSRAIVMESVADEFVELVLAEAKKLKVGNGMKDSTNVGPSVSEMQMKKVLEYHEIAKSEGHKLLIGGKRITDGDMAHGYFTEPTIYDHVKAGSRLAKEEVFGPVLSVIRVKSWEEAVEVANEVEYGLSSSVFTNDIKKMMEYVDDVETGMLHINSPTVGGEAQLPFGGVKATGVGQREMGETAMDFFTEWKTVYVDYTGTKRESKNY